MAEAGDMTMDDYESTMMKMHESDTLKIRDFINFCNSKTEAELDQFVKNK